MLKFPYIPTPYPDEILGSWLARAALLNDRGAWRSLLETTGYGRRIESPVFDMVTHSVKFESLISALGFGYEQAMIEMTTLPYWLTFDATDDQEARLPGMSTVPGVRGRRGRVLSSISSAGIGHSSGISMKFRYCPKCLEWDVSSCGEAYWHRAHHIPNVIVCHLHECALRHACPTCGMPVTAAAKSLIGLPALRCSCGQNLCATLEDEKPRPPYLALAKLSAEALTLGLPRWNRDQVRSHLRSILKRMTGQTARQYQVAIETAFGKWRDVKPMHSVEAVERHFQHPEFKLHVDFSAATAPECCALMVALDLGLMSTILEFIKSSTVWRMDIGERVPMNSWHVQSAKDELLRRIAKHPGRPPSRHRRPYWFLRLNDPEWLYSTFPTAKADPFPSIEQDRREIQRQAMNAGVEIARRRFMIKDSPAGLRAIFRDMNWLQDRLAKLRSEQLSTTDELRAAAFQLRVNSLRAALDEILKSEQRPIRIHSRLLGAAVGLSQLQASQVIRTAPELQSALAAANADKYRRQVLWAARQLHAKSRPLSLKAILKQASLPTLAKYFEFARAAVAQIHTETAA